MKTRSTGKCHGSKGQPPAFKNLQVQPSGDPHLAGYNPVDLFFEEIERSFGANVVLFRDVSSDEVIAGLWNPQTGPRPWKVYLAYSAEPSYGEGQDKEQISINKRAILNEMARLGGDLIDRIDVIR